MNTNKIMYYIDNYELLYKKDDENLDNKYVIGLYFKTNHNNFILNSYISLYNFYKFHNNYIYKYLYNMSLIIPFNDKLDILKIQNKNIICNNTIMTVNYVIIKTYWIKIIQRHWKKLYKSKIDYYKNINNLFILQLKKNFYNKFSICGLLNVYKNKIKY